MFYTKKNQANVQPPALFPVKVWSLSLYSHQYTMCIHRFVRVYVCPQIIKFNIKTHKNIAVDKVDTHTHTNSQALYTLSYYNLYKGHFLRLI